MVHYIVANHPLHVNDKHEGATEPQEPPETSVAWLRNLTKSNISPPALFLLQRQTNCVLFLIVLELDIVFSSLFAILVTGREIPEDSEGLFLIGKKKTKPNNTPISAQDFYLTEL